MAKQKTAAVLRLYNNSKQVLNIQVRAPNSDFYRNESQIRLMPMKDVTLPKSHVNKEQIQNLVARRLLKITYDSDAIENQRPDLNGE